MKMWFQDRDWGVGLGSMKGSMNRKAAFEESVSATTLGSMAVDVQFLANAS